MEKLIRYTTAYKIFSGDRLCGRLSHAYMLHFSDAKNLKSALLMFALEFLGAEGNTVAGRKILNGSFQDVKYFPQDGKKLTAENVTEIIDDCALKPAEGEKKLYIIGFFESASPLLQNKLLKTLEEPPAGAYFLLGATSLAPVLDTVKSRVKTLEIPPFTENQIFQALERRAHSNANARAAASSNGILGVAENMAQGGWFNEVSSAAKELCRANRIEDAGLLSAKYGDIQYREELLSEIQRLYFSALRGENELRLDKATLVFALESTDKAFKDLKFNANFPSLLHDF